jgi:hypothetical protein
MSRQYGLWIAVDEGDTEEKVRRQIDEDGKFTTVVLASEIRPKLAELCLVSCDHTTVDFIGISRAGRLVATNQQSIGISNLIPLRRVNLSSIHSSLPTRFQRVLPEWCPKSRRISPALWDAIIANIGFLDKEAAEEIQQLRKLVAEFNSVGKGRSGGVEVFERDAVAQALQTWGGPKLRKRVLRSATPQNLKEPASFLSQLNKFRLREDPQISHDANTFPGMDIARRYQIGAIELENETGERLTILNCNRQPLEKTLGVDLIYYSHVYDSFVLVQYKRMREESNGLVYRPTGDGNYKSEIEQMRQFDELLGQTKLTQSNKVIDYRLSNSPFFFQALREQIQSRP